MIETKLVHSNTISDLDNQRLLEFCSNFRDLENYSDVDYSNNNRSLLYKFHHTDIFTSNRGGLVLIYNSGRLVQVSGYNRSDFHPDIFICGVRTITLPEFRHNLYMSTYNVPLQTQLVTELGGKMMVYCFDTSQSKSVYNLVVNNKFNLFLRNRGSEFTDHALIYRDLTALEFPVWINYTLQNVLYKLLDPDFKFDWSTITVNNQR